jgi:hypothetical protein
MTKLYLKKEYIMTCRLGMTADCIRIVSINVTQEISSNLTLKDLGRGLKPGL